MKNLQQRRKKALERREKELKNWRRLEKMDDPTKDKWFHQAVSKQVAAEAGDIKKFVARKAATAEKDIENLKAKPGVK